MTQWFKTAVVELAVPQASGITAVGDGRFLVVDDDRGVYLAHQRGDAELLARRDDYSSLRDLEGICISPTGSVWVLSERTSSVISLPIERSGVDLSLGAPQLVGALPHIARKHNKGWEGLAILPGDPPRVLACHEAKPRRVGVFSLDSLKPEVMLSLSKPLRRALSDVSDLCVDPHTGHLLLVSDESACIVEARIDVDAEELSLLALTPLDLGRREKAEGLCFDAADTLWVVTDGDAHLRSFSRE